MYSVPHLPIYICLNDLIRQSSKPKTLEIFLPKNTNPDIIRQAISEVITADHDRFNDSKQNLCISFNIRPKRGASFTSEQMTTDIGTLIARNAAAKCLACQIALLGGKGG